MKKLYTVKNASEYLSVSTFAIRKWLRNGVLDCVRIGRCVRLRQSDLDHVVASGAGKQSKPE